MARIKNYVKCTDNCLSFVQDRLNWPASIDFSKKLFSTVHRNGYSEICIDLENIKRAYPNGIVPVICEIDAYRRGGVKFSLKEPLDRDVKSLFERNKWLHYIDPGYHKTPSNLPLNNLPLQFFGSDKELNDIVDQLIEVCLQSLVFSEGVPQAFEWAINEISGNVLVHSQVDHGWLQVITYPDNHKLALIVCDSGIGVPKVMRSAFSQVKTDQEALELAIRKGVTSNPQYGQGNGLAGSLAIAQGSKGVFAITSGRGRIKFFDGQIRPNIHFPPFNGTCVEMQFSTEQPIDLPKALWGYEPANYIETRFEDEQGDLTFRLREYASSFGNRITGEKIRRLILNLIKQNPGHSIVIDMSDVVVISSSFADELFGKLASDLGVIDFGKVIKLDGINPTCKGLIDVAIAQRLAQTIGYVTPVESDAQRSRTPLES